MNKEGLFIVIEGLDGSGKSTASKELKRQLNLRFQGKVAWTYEPENTCCGGEFIRDVLEKRIPDYDPFVLSLAYAANRLDHNTRMIQPWLSKGEDHIMVCDRYYLSSLVYNSSEDFSFDNVMLLNHKARKPDIIFFLNVRAEVCRQRMDKRKGPDEIFDKKLDLYRNKYFAAIKYLEQERGETIVEIDGNQSLDRVVASILEGLETHLFKNK
jgi:dTMP kinase